MSNGGNEEPRSSWEMSFQARVRADEIRFDEVPDTDVRFSGRPDYESVNRSERTNIPDEVERTTYQDVEVDYTLACRVKCHETS